MATTSIWSCQQIHTIYMINILGEMGVKLIVFILGMLGLYYSPSLV